MKTALTVFCFLVIFREIYCDLDFDWQEFKTKYGKKYNDNEDSIHKEIFKKTLDEVAEHKKKFDNGLVTYEIGVNYFADMTTDEFQRGFSGRILNGELGRASMARNMSIRSVPATVDWVKYGYNNPILSQGKCGSCYTFAAVAALEGQYFIKYKRLVKLSQQELLDCSRKYGNQGCYGGGWQRNIYKYMMENDGVGSEASNTYKDEERTCVKGKDRVQISSFYEIPAGDEEALKKAVATIGPIPIDMNHSFESFRKYTTGIYYEPKCNAKDLTHAMTVVGYGTENGVAYWKVRNSWGYWWGEDGYIRIARNRQNHCGVASRAVYPILK